MLPNTTPACDSVVVAEVASIVIVVVVGYWTIDPLSINVTLERAGDWFPLLFPHPKRQQSEAIRAIDE